MAQRGMKAVRVEKRGVLAVTPLPLFTQAEVDPDQRKSEEQQRAVRMKVKRWKNTLVMEYRYNMRRRVFLRYNSTAERQMSTSPLLSINSLRNAAMDRVRTRFLLPMDADFLPSANLYEDVIASVRWLRTLNAFGLVLPHFEVVECHGEEDETRWRMPNLQDYPTTFQQCYELLSQGVIQPFHASAKDIFHANVVEQLNVPNHSGCPEPLAKKVMNPDGVKLTGYNRWLRTSRQLMMNCAADQVVCDLAEGLVDLGEG